MGGMTRLAAVHGALPPHRYRQDELTDLVAQMCLPAGASRAVLDRIHGNVKVDTRHLALPLAQYAQLDGFSSTNDTFIEAGLDLAEQAVSDALAAAGIRPDQVDLIISVSVTGIATPSLEARLAPRLGLREDVVRIPVFGLGCVAGATGIALLADFLRGRPDGVAVLVAVELCSLTVQRGDMSIANLVASGLFGDGAAAVVAVGAQRTEPGPEVVAARSRLYPATERVMGWRIGEHGFQVVLAHDVAEVVGQYLADDVDGFLAEHGLVRADIAAWVCHPGGPKVLEAVQGCLGLGPDALAITWRSLAAVGNMSSVSVLHVLQDTIAAEPPAGRFGMLLAMGPGFCSQLVLLRW
jgi:alkylresorcinol/alkylpyrone synthase